MYLSNKTEFSTSDTEWSEEIRFPNTRTFEQYSHRIFNRYPARSISLVPRAIIFDEKRISSRKNLRVLDPFMGSGTTAVEACLAGCKPGGVELDPFARLISNVRTTSFSERKIHSLEKIAERLKTEWHNYEGNQNLCPSLGNIEYWFTQKAFSDLLKMKTAIWDMTNQDTAYRDFFKIVFADMIRPCSKAERQSLKPYISKKYIKTPSDIATAFDKSASIHIHAIAKFSTTIDHKENEIVWIGDNATSFKTQIKYDVAITSPPYINALDYIRCIKLESAWVGCGSDAMFSSIREHHVGDSSRRTDQGINLGKEAEDVIGEISMIDTVRGSTIRGYFEDMLRNIKCVHSALRKAGSYHVIVGNSDIRGVPVQTHSIIASLAESAGFKWENYYKYAIRDHRTSIPRNGAGGKINYEHVLALRKI